MDDMVPQNHMLRLIDKAINWNFIYDLVEEKYCPGARLLAKLERNNPAGSAKDRVALQIIRAAEAAGELRPGDAVVAG